MKLNVFDTVDKVLNAIADHFVETATEAISARGKYTVSLSGGSSPKKLYELLASANYKDKVEWNKVHFFFGDERNVPHNHADSNYLMVKTALFDPLKIESSQIFAVDTSEGPQNAAKSYAEDIEKYFTGAEVCFDLVLLGLGDNSHTASLFPHTPVLHDESVSVKEVFLEDQQVYRITMTAKMINQTRHIAFLVYGGGKAEAVHHVIEDRRNIDEYPAQLIKADNADIQWFLDVPAASKLVGSL